jgi:hypothetical protein
VARRRLALPVLGSGLLLIIAARLVLPAAPPLYDGVLPITPYLWLDPPPGDPGGATGATADITVRSGKSPLVAVATPEVDPQAQIFGPPGGLTVPAGARSIKVSIQPVPAEGTATDGHVDGNVYRITVTDEHGTAITAPASARVSVVLRATDPARAEATIARLSAGSWRPLKTSSSGFGGSFISVVTEFGDFAVIVPGPGPSTAATGRPTASDAAALVASGPSAASPGGSVTSNAPIPPADTSGLPVWMAPVLVVLALLLALVIYRGATSRRRRRFQGHPIRRR